MPITTRDILRKLRKAGFVEFEGGRYTKLKHPDGRRTVVPRHPGDVAKGVVKAIEKQTGVKLI